MVDFRTLLIPLFSFFIGASALNGQGAEFGFFGSLGIGFANSETTSVVPGASFGGGMFLTFPVNDKLDFGAGLGVEKIGFKETDTRTLLFGTDIINNMNGVPASSYLKLIHDVTITYVGLPVYLRYSWKNIAVKAGVKTLFFSVGGGDVSQVLGESGDISSTKNVLELNNKLVKPNFGPMAAGEYKLNNSLTLELMVFYGLVDLSNGAFSSDKKIGQAAVGINYYLTKSNK